MDQQVSVFDGVEIDVMSVGNFLRQKRMDAGLSQKDLADRANIGLSTIKQYESGKSQPTIEKAARMAQELKFDPRDLFREVASEGMATSAPDAVTLPDTQSASEDAAEVITPKMIAWSGLQRIRETVAKRGVGARFLPTVIREADNGLEQLSFDDLRDIADDIFEERADLEKFVVGLSGADPGRACDCLQDLSVVHSVYGDLYFDMTIDGLEELHALLAKTLEKNMPLKNVPPVRGFLDDFFSDEKSDRELRLKLIVSLANHLADMFRDRGAVIVLKKAMIDRSPGFLDDEIEEVVAERAS